jgi:hypothetical protein
MKNEGDDVDLSFTYYEAGTAPNGVALREEFLVTALTEEGGQWLDENIDNSRVSDAPPGPGEGRGNAWPKTRAEFDRLLKKAMDDGLCVSSNTETAM